MSIGIIHLLKIIHIEEDHCTGNILTGISVKSRYDHFIVSHTVV